MDFHKIKAAVSKQFDHLSKSDLFVTSVNKDDLWDKYLASFPVDSNPIYRVRSVHDCSCCKQFIRTVGNVVCIVDNKLVSIWDAPIADPDYQIVAKAMSEFVKSFPINNIFLHYEHKVGTDKSYEHVNDVSKTWDHFFVTIPNRNSKSFVVKKQDIDTKLSEVRSLHDVLFRSFKELTMDSIETVLELINQNSLYRGEEHKFVVTTFKKEKKVYDKIPVENQDNFIWSKLNEIPASVAKIRNTAIGKLLTDLSDDVDLEIAVRSFERMVAPMNYMRPTSLVTKSMIDSAKKKIEELGLTSSLERRYATISDITVNNIIFANREAKKIMTGNVFDDLAATASSKPKKFDKIEEVTIDKFISDIVPKASSIEVMFENQHVNKLVSLIAPVDPNASHLFKWENNFSWSYNGDLTDSIKERVKTAGGNVTGDFCCRLAWFNFDDLDFHMVEPGNYRISFMNKRIKSPSGGMLDVDMNAGGGTTRTPVENIFYAKASTIREGRYKLIVNQYCYRDSSDTGFEVEVDIFGTIYKFTHDKPLATGKSIEIATIEYSRRDGFKILDSIPNTQRSKIVWNIPTETFHKVNVMMFSPNYWDDFNSGNKHYFFMIDGCKNDDRARGFFNEYLKDSLNVHRKVFELVGSKMKVEASPDQLSGLGFSSTQRNTLVVKVTGKFTRTIKVIF